LAWTVPVLNWSLAFFLSLPRMSSMPNIHSWLIRCTRGLPYSIGVRVSSKSSLPS